jgi:hypothetical protein
MYKFQVAKFRVDLLSQITRSGYISWDHLNTHYLKTQKLNARTDS